MTALPSRIWKKNILKSSNPYFITMKRLNQKNRLSFLALTLGSILEGLITLVILFIIPTDSQNSGFLGYSLKRWILMGCILLSLGIFILFFLLKMNDKSKEFVDRIFKSRWVSVIFFISFFIFIILTGIYGPLTAWNLRIIPVLIYGSLVSIQVLVYQLLAVPTIQQSGEDLLVWLERKNFLLWFTLLLAIPLLFTSALKQFYPVGCAGLYTLMAEEIVKANFHLPMFIPFYGPGGIPFAYPPLGSYLMAVFLKLGLSGWGYLRFAPPLFSWLALIPYFLLARRISKSSLGGMVAAYLAAGSFYLYDLQTTSGGIVRGLAFALGLMTVFYFDRMVISYKKHNAILAGMFFGLTILTHLGYAYYFAMWMGIWMITYPGKDNWKGLGIVGMVSTFIALPWIIVMLDRYGFSIFSNAFQSHGNTNFLSMIQNPDLLIPLIQENLKGVLEQKWFLVFVVSGLVILVVQKKLTLPLLFLVVSLLVVEYRYILMVSFIVVGFFIATLYHTIVLMIQIRNHPLEKLFSSLVIIGLFSSIFFKSFNRLSVFEPGVNSDLLAAAGFMKTRTSAQASYLDLFIRTNEAEWLPYLTERKPVNASWGAEWIGTYELELDLTEELRDCNQDLVCLETTLTRIGRSPDYIIMTNGNEQIIDSLGESMEWINVYSNSRYAIWERKISDGR